MNHSYPKLLLLLAFPVFLLSCGGEDLDDIGAESISEPLTVANISYSDMVGHWELSAMTASEEVDLDGDGTGSKNLMQETTCFDPMSITFNSDMTFSSVNARLDFKAGENDDKFECMQGNTADNGTWDVEGDVLTLNVEVNGSKYTHTKTLILTDNTFSLEITKIESEQYVEDPGDTVVSHVQVVELEYTRSQS